MPIKMLFSRSLDKHYFQPCTTREENVLFESFHIPLWQSATAIEKSPPSTNTCNCHPLFCCPMLLKSTETACGYTGAGQETNSPWLRYASCALLSGHPGHQWSGTLRKQVEEHRKGLTASLRELKLIHRVCSVPLSPWLMALPGTMYLFRSLGTDLSS